MQTLLNGLSWAQLHYSVIVGVLGGTFGLSVLLEAQLHRLLVKYHIDNKKLSFSILNLLSIASAVSTWAITNIDGKEAAGVYAAVLIASQWWHRFVISDAYQKYVVSYIAWLAAQKTTSVAPAATITPTEPQPLSTTP